MAALIGVSDDPEPEDTSEQVDDSLDGIPIFDDRPIDFSGGAGLDGEPMVSTASHHDQYLKLYIVNCRKT